MEALSRPSLLSPALAAVALYAGFWTLALSICAGLAWIPIAQGQYQGSVEVGGLAAALMALTLLWAVRPREWFKKRPAQPEPLSREVHPALYAFVEEIAQRMAVAPPHALLLTGDANAFAVEERRWFGLQRRRLVGVGLPLFACTSRDELAAVLCHELGHHAGGDVRLGPWVYRTRRSIGQAVADLDGSAFFLDLPFRAYGRLFLRVSGAVSREQERAADALAAKAWGAVAAAGALEKVEVLHPLWSAYLHHEVFRYLDQGVRVPLLEGFRRLLRASSRRPEVQEAIDRAASSAPSPWDTHPSLDQRLEAIGRVRASVRLDEANCLELLGGEAAAEDAMFARWCERPPRRLEWEVLGADVVLPSYEKALRGTRLGDDPEEDSLGLGELPTLVASSEKVWDDHRGASLDVLSPEAKRRAARTLLAKWLATVLAARGFALRTEPGAPLQSVRGEEVVNPTDVVERLASGALTAADFAAWTQTL